MPSELPTGGRAPAGAVLTTAAAQARLDLADAPPVVCPPEGWQVLIDAVHGAVWLVDATTQRIVAASVGAGTLLGLPSRRFVGRPIRELFAAPQDQAFWDEAMAGVAAAIDSETFLVRDGAALPVRRRVAPVAAGSGDAAAAVWAVSVQDRSDEVSAYRDLALTAADLRSTLESTHDGLLVTDLSGRIRNFNRRFATLWGLPHEMLVRGDDDAVYEAMRRAVADPPGYMRRLAALEDDEMPPEAADLVDMASGRILERIVRPQRACGRPIGRVASFRDVTETVGAQQQVQRLAYADALTGLPNRRLFTDRIAQSLALARRQGSGFGLLLVDLDRFATVNQRLGRRLADDVLREAARRLADCLRQVDTVARLGSDDFVALVHHADVAGAAMAATRVVAALGRSYPLPDGRTVALDASVGIVLHPVDGSDGDTLLARARAALDAARDGGGGFRFWHDLVPPPTAGDATA